MPTDASAASQRLRDALELAKEYPTLGQLKVDLRDIAAVLDALDAATRWQWAIGLALSERALVWCEECSTIGTRSTSNATLCEECVLDREEPS